MAQVSTYLNFNRTTEQAFDFYRTVFGTDYLEPITRFGDIPHPGQELSEEDKKLVMFVKLPILAGHLLMGTDAPESRGFVITQGDNVNIHLEFDSREETDRLFAALAEGGTVAMPLEDMFWGAYFGMVSDKFGTKWMFSFKAGS